MASTDSVDVRDPRTPPSTTTFSPGASRSRWWAWLVLLVIVAGVVWYYRGRNSQADAAAAGGKGPGGAAGMAAAGGFVGPVVVATASKGDLPVFLNGLGNVTALNTVPGRSPLHRQIVQINFTKRP